MTILQHKHGGIVLAAGASSRMGRAKALLPTSSGRPLAAEQARRLSDAGVSDVVIVLGHDAETVAVALSTYPVRYAFNADWESGRLSSLQAGLIAMPSEIIGALVVPVDAPGIKAETFAALLAFADRGGYAAVRAFHHGHAGHVLWINRGIFVTLLALTPNPDFRVDHWIASRETRIDVDDAAILNNINTPEAWETK